MTPYPARSSALTPRWSQPGRGAYDGATTPIVSPFTSAGGLRSGGSAEVESSGLIEQGREQRDPAGPTNVATRPGPGEPRGVSIPIRFDGCPQPRIPMSGRASA